MESFSSRFLESLGLRGRWKARFLSFGGVLSPLGRAAERIFFRGERDKELYLRLLEYMLPYSRRLVFAVFCMAATGLFDAGPIALLQPILDEIFTNQNRQALGYLPVLLVVLFGLKGIFNFSQKYLMRLVAQKVIRDLRLQVFRHVLSLPLSYFTQQRSGEIISRITNDIHMIDKGVSTVLSDLFKDVFTIISLVLVILVLDWRFAMVSLLAIPLLVAPIGYLAQILRRASKITQEMVGIISSITQESIGGIPVIKAFNAEHFTAKRFHVANEKYYFQAKRAIQAASASTPITEFIGACLAAVVIYFGGNFVIDGVFSSGTFIACLAALFKMYMPFKQLGNVSHSIQQAVTASDRIFSLLDADLSIHESPMARPLLRHRETVTYEGVSYDYGDKNPVLKDVSLTVQHGESVALVGPSGSGKTTMVHLLPRFFDPTEGRICIDGVDLKDVTLESLRRQIGIVSQDVILFHDTVSANIAYGADEHDQQRVIDAARAAYADEFILNLEQGYSTVIGERGASLSGGQRQRLSLARALYHDPAILILDEATSALDPESEQLVQQAIQRLMKSRTTFIIAHRLSTIRHVDRILVLSEGRIVEDGTHEELLRPGTVYKRFHDMQFATE